MSRFLMFLAAAFCVASTELHGQASVERVVGRVLGDSGVGVTAATVLLTRAPDRAVFQGATDASGRFSIAVPNGTGDYLVYISAPGYVPLRRRATRASGADSTVLVGEIALQPVAGQQLTTVTVRASSAPARPQRRRDPGTQVGASEALVDDFAAAVPPELAGDPAALAATVPGVQPTGGGISVLGLDPTQNNTTLNGIAFGSSFPRAANVTTRVTTSTYDPARGWFGGANTNIEFGGGSVFHLRTGYVTLDAPVLQATEPVSQALGQQVTGGTVSLGASGPIGRRDRFFFNTAIQAGRQERDVPSLFTSTPDVLSTVGLAADSVSRLRDVLLQIGVGLGDSPGRLVTQQVSLLTRVDFDPRPVQSIEAAKRTAALTVFGNATQAAPIIGGLSASPLNASRRSSGDAGVQAEWSSFWGRGYLTTLRSGLSAMWQTQGPVTALPGAAVLLRSDLPAGDAAVATLAVGGASPAQSVSRWTWESTAETQWYVHQTNAHRLTATGSLRVDGLVDPGPTSPRATFTFNSLADLAAGIPTSYQRETAAAQRPSAVANAFLALGDQWRVSRTLRMQYGVRAEANRYLTVPSASSPIVEAFGVQRDAVPNTWDVSPRLGFTWTRRGAGNAGALAVNRLGAFNLKPTSFVRGGVGVFRALMPASLLRDALSDVRTLGAPQGVTCLGSAAPHPEWARYRAEPTRVPATCVENAAGGAPLVDSAPRVNLVSRSYTAPRSWRANLAYESQWRWLMYSAEGTYSLNLHQPGRTDLNLTDRVAFLTADERRPVFVPASTIAQNSGLLPLTPSRRQPSFGQVVQTDANGRSTSRQLILSVAPTFDYARQVWAQLSYVLSDVRAWRGGFDASTFGSPVDRTWSRAPGDVRHQFLVRGGGVVHGVALTLFGRLSSGTPFTPMVGQDVNGDGLVNDRASLGTGSSPSGDPALVQALRNLAATSSAARRCLAVQPRGDARPMSCEGDWTTTLNAQVSASPRWLSVGGRLPTVRLNVANPLAGLDQLLHGTERLRGWGTAASPDPVLLNVRGFNPAAQRFAYEVNPRFATARTSLAAARTPFRVTIDVRLDLSPSLPRQQLGRYLGPGRGGRAGARLTVAQLQQRYAREVVDPYAAILGQSDSLLLSRTQVEALQAAQLAYRPVVDSVWRDLATAFAALPDEYNAQAAVQRQERAIEDARELTRLSVRATLGGILDPIQLQLMPGAVGRLFRADKPLTRDGRTFFSR